MRRSTYIAFLSLLVVRACLGQAPGQVSTISTNEFIDERHFTENQYFESFILKDIALMLFYSKAGTETKVEVTAKDGLSNQFEYVVSFAQTNVAIHLSTTLPAWEPARYETAADQLAAALKVQRPAQSAPQSRSILAELSNPTIETISKISMDLSEKLKRNMLDSSLHERAALLLAAFGLRERLEPVDDPRWALSRLTAHLALSYWVSGKDPGSDGAYALVSAYALMNLQTNALGRLHRLEAIPQTSVPWNRALYARITADPRGLTSLKPSDLSRLEWAERIYAVSRSISKEIGANELRVFATTNGEAGFDSDFFFCVFRGWGPGSVSLGRSVYLPAGLRLTLRDAALAWQCSQGSAFKIGDLQEFATRLNVEPGTCVHPEGRIDIVDWGAWATQTQRRLAAIYPRRLRFIRDSWGLPKDDVDKEKAALDKSFGGLWLVRCARVEFDEWYEVRDTIKIFAARRPVIPISTARYLIDCWNRANVYLSKNKPIPQSDLAAAQWTACGFPNQTLVSIDGNIRYLENNLDLQFMFKQAPFSAPVIRRYIESPGRSSAEIDAALRPLADYETSVARMLAGRLPPEDFKAKEAVYQKLAGLDPDYYLELTDFFVKTNLPKAALYFERARVSNVDLVAISHRSEQFVRYYLSIGNKSKAEELAKEAEEVGSARGFEAMMTYCILTHDFERGLKSAEANAERYGDHTTVILYLDQVKKEQPGYHELDSLYKRNMSELFPNGINAYQSSSAAPPHGALIQSNARSLRIADIVVALNGKSVETVAQLRYLRKTYTLETGEDKNIPMWVYREGRYLEVKDTTAEIRVADYSLTGVRRTGNSSAPFSPATTVQSNPPAHIKGLRLTGISGAPGNRFAMINGKTLAEGESTSVSLEGQTHAVRCLCITERWTAVQITGYTGTKFLYLNDPAAD